MPKGKWVHVDAAHHIPVSLEGTGLVAAAPLTPFHSLFPAAYWTLAARSPLRASEALDARCFGFIGEVGHILPVFPRRHPLIVVASAVASAHAVWIADEQFPHTLLLAEGDQPPRAFVAQVAYLPAFAGAHLAPGGPQPSRASRALLAAPALPRQLSKGQVMPTLQGSDPAARHHQRCALVGGHGSLVNFSQVDGRLGRPRSRFSGTGWNRDVQLKAVLPDELAAPNALGQVELEHQRTAPSSHRQHDTSPFHADCLGRPEQREVPLVLVGVADPGVGVAQFPRGLDVGQEGMQDHLHRLAVQRELPFGSGSQVGLVRPGGMRFAGGQMQITADGPDPRGFQAGFAQALGIALAQRGKGINANGFHREGPQRIYVKTSSPLHSSFCRAIKRKNAVSTCVPWSCLTAGGCSHSDLPFGDGSSRTREISLLFTKGVAEYLLLDRVVAPDDTEVQR